MYSLGFTQTELSLMASLNPARVLKINGERGSIEPGKRADLVALDEQGGVRTVMIGGRTVS
jgi:N-acetylglucosamine-6-phosphate deacetylase